MRNNVGAKWNPILIRLRFRLSKNSLNQWKWNPNKRQQWNNNRLLIFISSLVKSSWIDFACELFRAVFLFAAWLWLENGIVRNLIWASLSITFKNVIFFFEIRPSSDSNYAICFHTFFNRKHAIRWFTLALSLPRSFSLATFSFCFSHIDFDFFALHVDDDRMEWKKENDKVFSLLIVISKICLNTPTSPPRSSGMPAIRRWFEKWFIHICWWRGRGKIDICDCEFEHKTNWKIIRATQIAVFPPIDNDSAVNVNRFVSMSLHRCWMFTSGWMKRRGKRSLAKEPIHPPQYRQGLLAIENRSKRLGSLFVKAILWSRPSPHSHHTPPAIGYKSFNWLSGDGYQMSRNRVNWCCRPLSPVNQMSSEIM